MVLSNVGVHLLVALASRKDFWDMSFAPRRALEVNADWTTTPGHDDNHF